MNGRNKLIAALWMLITVEKRDLTHRQKTEMLKLARGLLTEAVFELIPNILQDMDDIPF